MSEKVKLPWEVAKAIEKLRAEDWKDSSILWKASRDIYEKTDNSKSWKILSEFVFRFDNIFLLADALRYGYEIELRPITVIITPERQEQIKRLYDSWDDSKQSGFRETLQLLGIKIPGITVED